MTDTVELLALIGCDASLKHATGEPLARAIAARHASRALQQAARSGDARGLLAELGLPVDPPPPNHNHTHGGCDHEDDEGDGDTGTPQHPDDEA